MIALAHQLYRDAGLAAADIAQTVLGCPGVFDSQCSALSLTGARRGREEPLSLEELRSEFGSTLALENDVNAAALAEQVQGRGRGVDNFVFLSVGTGLGAAVILDGRLRRGAHGTAGEIGYLPLLGTHASGIRGSRRRTLETEASAAGIVRAARRAGNLDSVSARDVFAAALAGDSRARKIVRGEAILVATAICVLITVVDPDLVVLGGGIGQAEGFLDAVARELGSLAPVVPDLCPSALGDTAVVDGCLAAGLDRTWERITSMITAPATSTSATAS